MRFRDDERGVTIQIGAVLFFATVIIALSLYQATVVPSQNADVEYKHSQSVEGQLADVRNGILQSAATGNSQSATVKLGVQYPSRVFLMNPPPATGTLSTNSHANNTMLVTNVEATNNETRDFINGTWDAPTKYLQYSPDYHEYDNAPNRIYEASVLYNHYPESNTSIPLTDQIVLQGNTITLVALNGSLSTSQSGAVSVTATPVSAPYQRVQVQPKNAAEPVNVSIPTKLTAAQIRNSTNIGDDPNVTVVDGGTNRVVISLSANTTYTLQTARVDVGSQATTLGATYLTVVETNDDSVTVEARDRFNNPVDGVTVSVNGTNPFESSSKVTGVDGRATFEFKDGASGTGTLEISGGSAARERVTVSVPTTGTAISSGNVTYLEDAVAHDGPDSNGAKGGVNLTVANNYSQNVTITDITIEAKDSSVDVLADRVTGSGPMRNELYVAGDVRAGYTDFSDLSFSGGNDGTAIPREVDIDIDGREHPQNPVLGPGENATVYLYEFFTDSDDATNVDMVGKPVNVTVTYRLEDQRVGESQFTVTPESPAVGGGGPTVAYVADGSGDLETVTASGVQTTYSTAAASYQAIGDSNTDIDGDTDVDIAYVDGNDNLLYRDASGNTATLDASGSVSGGGVGVGDWDDDGTTEVVYVRNGNVYEVEPGGTPRIVQRDGPGASTRDLTGLSVAGVGDMDGDGDAAIVYVDNSQTVRYIETDGGTRETTGVNAPTVSAVSEPADFDGDGTIEVALVDGSANIELVEAGGSDGVLNPSYSVSSARLAALDMNGDGTPEVVHVDGSNQLRYVTSGGSTGFVTDDNGNVIVVKVTTGAS